MSATFADLLGVDAALAAAGHHPLTAFWREQLARFYAHPTARTLVARVGRGGAKSHTSAKVALVETLFGRWETPPGERHFWAFVSRSKDEAAQRNLLLQSFLRALGVPFDVDGDEIRLRDMPRGFRVFACQVGAVSGFRCFGYSADELAKWTAGIDAANPASEVCSSLNAMCVTHVGARKLLISSPVSVEDYHARRFALGDTADQLTAHAATWVANPSVTEAQTREAEPDEPTWRSEYAAIPRAALAAAFDPALIEHTARPFPRWAFHQPILALDASGGGDCEFAHALISYARPPRLGEPIDRVFPRVDEHGNDVGHIYQYDAQNCVVRDRFGRPCMVPGAVTDRRPVLMAWGIDGFTNWSSTMGLDTICDSIADKMHAAGVRLAVGDHYLGPALESQFRHRGLTFKYFSTTNANKVAAVKHLRLLLSGRQLVVGDETTRAQLMAYRELVDGSTVRHAAKAGTRSDRVSVLINALIAEAEGALPWSPTWSNKRGRGGVPEVFAE
ncbi:MAG: hypothetical protein QM756_26575 [Polyangiaceae bacterium]